MIRAYLDSNALIAAATDKGPAGDLAQSILADPTVQPVSSVLVALEVLPQCIHNRRAQEEAFYNLFFKQVDFVELDEGIGQMAFNECRRIQGLSPMDALHLAAAKHGRCDELLTLEGETKPMFKSRLVKVRRLK